MTQKNIAVIGASSGIGQRLTRELLEAGEAVYATGRRPESELDFVPEHYLQLDVTSGTEQLRNFMPDTLHGLVYCPGTINLKPFNRLSEDDFINDYKVNVLGAVAVVQELLAALKNAKHASVVFFSTVATQTGMPFHASVSAAKSALEGLSISLAAEYAQANIRFNVLAPSITDTPLASRILGSDSKRENSAQRHPLKRVGDPAEVAKTVQFLLSKDAGWITGQVWGIDGGMASLRA